jgi:glucose-1-phosphate cytidylyltransferase
MKVVIFAGGMGSRIAEESHLKPKPMIEIGGKPILWHIMKLYAAQGFNDFVICLGYKGHLIKEYFLNYYMYNSDLSIDVSNNKIDVHYTNTTNFKITLIDTGLHTLTAGRLNRIKEHIDTEDFFLTYGDGLADIDLNAELEFHKNRKKMVSMTIVQPEGRFGAIKYDENQIVTSFQEKPKGDGTWINGGFFILNKKIFDYLPDNSDELMWEQEPLEKFTEMGELAAYKHDGFWHCMDSMKDKSVLETLWENKQAKWKSW